MFGILGPKFHRNDSLQKGRGYSGDKGAFMHEPSFLMRAFGLRGIATALGRLIVGSDRGWRLMVDFAKSYGVRTVLYHEVATQASEFTAGLGLTVTPDALSDQLTELANHYEFVDLQQLLQGDIHHDEKPPLLVTFDDAYASIATTGARICADMGIPSVFFVSGAFVDNRTVSLDNAATWAYNTHGLCLLEEAAGIELGSLSAFFQEFLPGLGIPERSRLKAQIEKLVRDDLRKVVEKRSLYVTSNQLAGLPQQGMTLGNHTWSHVHCRHLSQKEFEDEVVRNAEFLTSVSGLDIRVFSYPYGSATDATPVMTSWLRSIGYEAAFLVEGRPNLRDADMLALSRVSMESQSPRDAPVHVEVLPRLRVLRDRLKGLK